MGRLPSVSLRDMLEEMDVVCAGRFAGESEALNKSVKCRWPAGWIVRPGPRIASFHVEDVINGDLKLTGSNIRVAYVASLPLPPTAGHAGSRGTEFPDLAQKLRGKRCLLQLLSREDGTWEIRFGGDSYMLLGPKPEAADWDELTGWQRLEREFASAILDPNPLVAGYAIASATTQQTPAAGPVLLDALRQRQTGEPKWLAHMATMGLASIGDLDAIYNLQATLHEWKAEVVSAYPQDVLRAFSSMGDPFAQINSRNAVPALVGLSSDPDAGIRWSATLALRRIGGRDAVAALAARLDDDSSDVRYQAIQGLANALKPRDVGVKNWTGYAPAVNLYDKDPDTPVRNWKRWWTQKGKAKYPPVENVLKKAERFRTERPWAHTAQAAE